jgi:hypothetical protein
MVVLSVGWCALYAYCANIVYDAKLMGPTSLPPDLTTAEADHLITARALKLPPAASPPASAATGHPEPLPPFCACGSREGSAVECWVDQLRVPPQARCIPAPTPCPDALPRRPAPTPCPDALPRRIGQCRSNWLAHRWCGSLACRATERGRPLRTRAADRRRVFRMQSGAAADVPGGQA